MALTDVTAEGVRAAIDEFDALGREGFLRKYGFGEAKGYFLLFHGRQYDSKAIVGAAHGYGGVRPALRPSDFSGGERTVAHLLTNLGFEVVAPKGRNPPWSEEELILALELYLSDGLLDDEHPKVVALSEALNRLEIHDDRPDAERFRNGNGVALKLANFAALDPGHRGKGMSGGGKRDGEIWRRFAGDERALSVAADGIRNGLGYSKTALQDSDPSASTGPAGPITLEVEAVNTETFEVRRTLATAQAVRREHQLVQDYKAHLVAQGHRVVRHQYTPDSGPLYCDLFDETTRTLVEAKGDVSREGIRMAVGQLLDYRRFEKDVNLAILLPRRPVDDLIAFCASVGITCIFQDVENGWSRKP